jgi:hypothetical protein
MSLKSTSLDRHPTEEEIRQPAAELGINLAVAYRPKHAYPILGWGHSQTAVKVETGEIEAPIPLSESGSAVAWTGRQLVIIIWRRLQLAAKRRQVAA